MIADTTFLIHWARETTNQVIGPARTFLAQRRREAVRTIVRLSRLLRFRIQEDNPKIQQQ